MDGHKKVDDIEIIDIDKANKKAQKLESKRQIEEQQFMQLNDQEQFERSSGIKMDHDLGILRISSIKTQPQLNPLQEFKTKKSKK